MFRVSEDQDLRLGNVVWMDPVGCPTGSMPQRNAPECRIELEGRFSCILFMQLCSARLLWGCRHAVLRNIVFSDMHMPRDSHRVQLRSHFRKSLKTGVEVRPQKARGLVQDLVVNPQLQIDRSCPSPIFLEDLPKRQALRIGELA